MLSALRWLALEVRDLDAAEQFYTEDLGMCVVDRTDRELRLDAGAQELVLRRPRSVPRGGLHTHYAMAIPRSAYDERYAKLAERFDVSEHRFGDARSLYLHDPDGHCVEFGERDVAEQDPTGSGIDRIFEVVLEVRSLERAESFYADLGFETVNRGSDRPRVRMDGPVELELWEPHVGLAGARGGVHVDLGFAAEDPESALAPVADRLGERVELDDGVRVLDPDGHWLTVRARDPGGEE